MNSFLKHKLTEIKQMNPSFSIRAFAKKAGISPGAMSEIVQGKRKITQKMAEKIIINLNLNPTERNLFLAEIGISKPFDLGIKKVSFLSRSQFQFITEGYHFALLSLLKTKDFRNDISWIAQRLNISIERAQLAVNRLVQANLIRIEDGKILKTKTMISTSDDVKDSYVQASHLDTLKLAKNSLLNDPVNLRDFTYFTFPADPELIPLVKEKIRAFQDEIYALFEGRENTEVYRLAIHFFPQTKKVSDNNQKGDSSESIA